MLQNSPTSSALKRTVKRNRFWNLSVLSLNPEKNASTAFTKGFMPVLYRVSVEPIYTRIPCQQPLLAYFHNILEPLSRKRRLQSFLFLQKPIQQDIPSNQSIAAHTKINLFSSLIGFVYCNKPSLPFFGFL